MKLLDILILLVIAAAVAVAVVYMRKRKKAGKCIGCSGDCSQCGLK